MLAPQTDSFRLGVVDFGLVPAAVAGVIQSSIRMEDSVGDRETDPPPGITADELIRLVKWRSCPLTAVELRRWLVAAGFAVERDGKLQATQLGASVGGSLRGREGG